MWFQAPFSGPLPLPQPPDLNRPPPPPPRVQNPLCLGRAATILQLIHVTSSVSGGRWPSHLPRWMRRNKERQAWDGAMELEDSSGASRPPIFYIEGDPTSRMKGREPGPPAY